MYIYKYKITLLYTELYISERVPYCTKKEEVTFDLLSVKHLALSVMCVLCRFGPL